MVLDNPQITGQEVVYTTSGLGYHGHCYVALLKGRTNKQASVQDCMNVAIQLLPRDVAMAPGSIWADAAGLMLGFTFWELNPKASYVPLFFTRHYHSSQDIDSC